MEVKKDEGINIGTNPFYQPSNTSYGQPYVSSEGQNPLRMGDIPLYNETVSEFYNTKFVTSTFRAREISHSKIR